MKTSLSILLTLLAGLSWSMSERPKVEETKVEKSKVEKTTQVQNTQQQALPGISLIPLPAQVETQDGFYELKMSTDIVVHDSADFGLMKSLVQVSLHSNPTSPLNALKVKIPQAPGVIPGISFRLDSSFASSQYVLSVDQGIQIKAAGPEGWHLGLQTLKQILLQTEVKGTESQLPYYKVPKMLIQDQAKHSWRGVMIDVSRHFFGMEVLYKLIDRMAFYKLNKLHLHLSDDQGWRMEIKAYPALAQVGGASEVGGGPGGFYTQAQLKKLVEYAQARHIELIPEFDMPGHVYAALISVPELNCADGSNIHPNDWEPNPPRPPEPYTRTKVGWNKLCLNEPKAYEFFSQVMAEVVEVFPAPYIHVGGDEIKDSLFTHFIHYADSVIRSHNRVMIGWEEVLESQVGPKTIAQIWRRVDRGEGSRMAMEVQAPVILSACENFYLDHGNIEGQPKTMNWCAPDVTLRDIYTYEEHPKLKVIGFEAPVWTEFVDSEAELDNRFFPRLLGLAERTWTPKSQRNYEQFEARVSQHLPLMDAMGIQYFKDFKHTQPSKELKQ